MQRHNKTMNSVLAATKPMSVHTCQNQYKSRCVHLCTINKLQSAPGLGRSRFRGPLSQAVSTPRMTTGDVASCCARLGAIAFRKQKLQFTRHIFLPCTHSRLFFSASKENPAHCNKNTAMISPYHPNKITKQTNSQETKTGHCSESARLVCTDKGAPATQWDQGLATT